MENINLSDGIYCIKLMSSGPQGSSGNMGNIVYIYLMCNIFSARLVKYLERQVMLFWAAGML